MSWLQYCVEQCKKTPYKRGTQRHYAVIVDKRDRLVSEGANDYRKTHTLMAKASKKLGMRKEFCHAECLALVRARGKGVKMYVARVDSQGEACYSAPCVVCASLISESQIKSIEFTV
jgi:deoxycytidylate deaminase